MQIPAAVLPLIKILLDFYIVDGDTRKDINGYFVPSSLYGV